MLKEAERRFQRMLEEAYGRGWQDCAIAMCDRIKDEYLHIKLPKPSEIRDSLADEDLSPTKWERGC